MVGLLDEREEKFEVRHSFRKSRRKSERRRHPTPLRLLQLTRQAKDQGLWTVCVGNAETATPTVASRASFRRTPANCCALTGSEARGTGLRAGYRIVPVITCLLSFDQVVSVHVPSETISTSQSNYLSAIKPILEARVHSPNKPLIPSVWTRSGPSVIVPFLSKPPCLLHAILPRLKRHESDVNHSMLEQMKLVERNARHFSPRT